jgi:uncharacterized protein
MKIFKITLTFLLVLFVAVALLAKMQASDMVNHPIGERSLPRELPSDAGVDFEVVQVTSSDGYNLEGWYVPSHNGSLIIMQHGYKYHRGSFKDEIPMFANAGYGILATTIRAHENNPGEQITFGVEEMKDLDAWVQFALELPDIDTDKIGMLGDSLGGSMVIQYASSHDTIKAVVAHSAFSSLEDSIAASVTYFTGLPAFPFAPLIKFWAELELGIDVATIDATKWIGNISPRPVFIINSLDDVVISPKSGELLFAAAQEPKQLWQEFGVEHVKFDETYPEQYEQQVIGFFNQHFFP